MAVFRYPPAGVERLVQQSSKRTLITRIAMLGGVGIAILSSASLRSATVIPVSAALFVLVLWISSRSKSRLRAIIESTEIRIDERELVGSSSVATAAISRNDVVELRHLRNGVLVRGRGAGQALQVRRELEGYDILLAQLQEWLPPDVARTESRTSANQWIIPLVLANIGLMVAAFSVQSRVVGFVCCITEAVALGTCTGLVLRSRAVTPQLKRRMLITALPIFALLGRALTLAQNH